MLLTVKDVSSYLQVKPSTVYAWAKQGKIPCKRLNGVVRFVLEEVQSWVQRCSIVQPPPVPLTLSSGRLLDVDAIVEAAKREVYTPRHGETRPKSGLIGKGDADGAV